MCPSWDEISAKQKNAEERRLQKKGCQALIGEKRRYDVCRYVGKAAPVRAELERHNDAGYDAHAERNGKYLDPEGRCPKIDILTGRKMHAFEHGNIRRQPDGKSWQQNMPRNDPNEL